MAEPPTDDLSLLSDQQLLAMFSDKRDAEAFRELVVRHSPLVLATCRRGLHSAADADDAFQATFLVLARSAAKIRHRQALGAWLYGVATRVCLRMRRDAARRSTQELLETAGETMDPLDELLARHDEMVVDEELRRLPSALRDPLVLRYLGGKSNTEVARQLGLSIAALEGRLKRGKQQLRMRLIRRGVTLIAVVATLKATRVAAGEVPLSLVDSAVTLGTSTAAAASAIASASSSTTQIAFQELHAMNTLFALKPVTLALSACGLAAAVIVATQVGFSPRASAQGGRTIKLAVDEESSPAKGSDPATVAVEIVPTNERAAGSDPLRGRSMPNRTPLSDVADLKPRSESEIRIERALKSEITKAGFNFTDVPLSEFVTFLRDEYELEVQIDFQALDELGMSPDEPMTINLRNIRLDSALDLLLQQYDLTYIIYNEVLLITSEDRALSTLETRAYPTNVVSGQSAEELIEVITSIVAPDTWKESGGGEGAIALIGNRLVVRQTYAVHREINELLSQLRDVPKESPEMPGAPGGMQRR